MAVCLALTFDSRGKYRSYPPLDKNGTTRIYRNKWDKYGSTRSVVRPFGSAIRSFGHSVKSGYRSGVSHPTANRTVRIHISLMPAPQARRLGLIGMYVCMVMMFNTMRVDRVSEK